MGRYDETTMANANQAMYVRVNGMVLQTKVLEIDDALNECDNDEAS
jgi:hypothetical protein